MISSKTVALLGESMRYRSLLWTGVIIFIAMGCGAPAIPDGWIAVPLPPEDEVRCASFEGTWGVEVRRGELVLTLRERVTSAEDEGSFTIEDVDDPEADSRLDHVIAFDEGWLVAVESRENLDSGGAWWIDRGHDGRRYSLYEGKVMGLERSREGVLIFVGSDDPEVDRGAIVSAARNGDGQWAIENTIDLASAPRVFAPESPSTFFVLDGNSLNRFHTDTGRVEWLVDAHFGMLHPTSMAIAEPNMIFVGMRHAVARFNLTTRPPTVDWLVRQQCPHLRRLSEWECYCVGGPSPEEGVMQTSW